MASRNEQLLPLVSMLATLSTTLVEIGGLILIRNVSNSISASGFISSLGSIGLICSTLFIGSKLDGSNKKKSLVVTNFIMGITLLLTFLFRNQSFIFAFVIADVVISFLALIASLSVSGLIKQSINEKIVKKVISNISSSQMIGAIISLVVIALLITVKNGSAILLAIAMVIYFINGALSCGISNGNEEEFKAMQTKRREIPTLKQLKSGYDTIMNSKSLKDTVLLTICVVAMQGVFNGLIIYFWKNVDPSYGRTDLMLIAYAVGVILGIVQINLKRMSMTFIIGTVQLLLLFASITFFLFFPTVISLSFCIVFLMWSTIPLSNWTVQVRIKNTDVSIQSSQAGFVKFGVSIAEVFLNMIVAPIAQFFGHATLMLLVGSLLTLLVFLSVGKRVKAYE